MEDLIKEMRNQFFKVYGENILKLYEDAYKFRHPGPQGNISYEAGMDFQGWIQQFIEKKMNLAFHQGQIEQLKEDIKTVKKKRLRGPHGADTKTDARFSNWNEGNTKVLEALREKLAALESKH